MLAKYLLSAFLIGLIINGNELAIAQTKQPDPQVKAAAELAKPPHRAAKSIASVPKLPSSPIREPEATKIVVELKQPPPPNYDAWRDSIPQWLMAVAALIGVILSGIAIWLLSSTLKATRDAADYAKRAAEASEATIEEAKKATIAAQKSADVAERSASHIDRPYIFSTDIYYIEMDKVVGKLKFKLTNFGRTPAIIHEVWAKFTVEKEPPTIPYEFAAATRYDSFYVLGTGDGTDEYSYEIPTETKLKQIVVDGITHVDIDIGTEEKGYFILCIVYHDVQGNAHSTEFCWTFDAARHYFIRDTVRQQVS